MIQYAENRKRWEESRKIAMTTVIQNSGIQLGWNRMRKRRNPALDRNETVRKSGAARVRTHRSVRKSAATMNAANPRHRRMPAVTVKRHRADDRTRDVSAYDMALITRAAFENPTFAKIVETTYYKLPPNQKNPEGQGISPGNKLVKKNWPQYYRPDVLGGKTGYTSIALNTLVNGARQGDTTLITVILHSNNTQYEDTSRLLDFGFNNFQSVKIADYDRTFSNIGKDLKIADVSTAGGESLSIDPDSRVVLPKTADFSETTTSFDYEIPAGAPDGTIACVTYSLGDHKVGQAYLTLTDSCQTAADIPEKLVSQVATAAAQDSSDTALSNGSSEALPLSNPPESAANQENSSTGKSFGQLFHISVRVPPAFIAALTAILVVSGAVTAGIRFLQMQRRQEEDALAERRRRRAERLRDSGMSEADFDLMMQDRRTALAKKRKKRSHKIP